MFYIAFKKLRIFTAEPKCAENIAAVNSKMLSTCDVISSARCMQFTTLGEMHVLYFENKGILNF